MDYLGTLGSGSEFELLQDAGVFAWLFFGTQVQKSSVGLWFVKPVIVSPPTLLLSVKVRPSQNLSDLVEATKGGPGRVRYQHRQRIGGRGEGCNIQ